MAVTRFGMTNPLRLLAPAPRLDPLLEAERDQDAADDRPGGFEELFIRHRSDQEPPPPPLGFVEDAVRHFNSVFEDHPNVC